MTRSVRSSLAVAVLAALALPLASCAPLPSGPAVRTPPPASSPAPVPAPPPAPEEQPGAAAIDSTPSREAEAVLARIPEPLAGSPRVPPAARDTARTIMAAAPEAAYDTLRAERDGDGDAASVPVPAATPAAATPPVTFAPHEGGGAPPRGAAPKTAETPPGAAAPQGAGSVAGECWRLQVAAPDEPAKAVSRREAAESLLLASMVIEREGGLHKVRTRDCLSREAAASLRQRALDSGFDGAFLVNTAAKPVPKPAAKPAGRRTARKPRRR